MVHSSPLKGSSLIVYKLRKDSAVEVSSLRALRPCLLILALRCILPVKAVSALVPPEAERTSAVLLRVAEPPWFRRRMMWGYGPWTMDFNCFLCGMRALPFLLFALFL